MYRLERRYLFSGTLRCATAVHIGHGHDSLSLSDSPIIRTADGLPFIPGSSFKGVLRSTVEKLAGSIPWLRACALSDGDICVNVQGALRAAFDARRSAANWSDDDLVREAREVLCDTCRLFGSHYLASHILCSDLYPPEGDDPATQVRDGVGIDRDSECAVPRIKYDFEVVESNSSFLLEVQLENPSDRDLQLTCVGLAEVCGGFVAIGGKRSRGLGRCTLTDLRVHVLDLSDPRVAMGTLQQYLVARVRGQGQAGRGAGMAVEPDAQAFLVRNIEQLLSEGGAAHA